MEIPASSHPAWQEILTGKRQCQFEFLAIQLALRRLMLHVSLRPTPEALEKCTTEFREIFVKNIQSPKVQRDITKIWGSGGKI